MKEGNVKEMVDNLISTYVKFCFRLLSHWMNKTLKVLLFLTVTFLNTLAIF